MRTGFWWVLLAVAVYGVIRSGLASWRTRKLAKRVLGEKIYQAYRLFLTLVIIIGGLGLIYLVDTLPDVKIYHLGLPWVLLTIPVQVLCFAGALASLNQTDIWDLTGIRRLFCPEKEEPPTLVISGMYYWVRHPLYVCALLFVWLMPVMTWNILAFNIGITIAITIGVLQEEKRLLKNFGEEYAEYQKRVPMLFPGFWLKKPKS
ncbi:MAG: isoprenylcysteine carboxylmethyltransferase family protein [Anaerolineaceae bacterium]|nr:isoprenylcysteine carboxylmethyltransferase family protein [Anaerolineaceae bacterium]